MKTLTWNVNRAGDSRLAAWEMLQREDADIVLLQEVGRIPDWILKHYRYNCYSKFPMFFNGRNADFQTVILSKWTINKKPFLASEFEWVNKIHSERYGWIIECEIVNDAGVRFRVVSVHSPFFCVPRESLADVDISSIKLKNNPDIWFTEILWSLIRNADITRDMNWIVGGDFNSSEKFDVPKDRGNREIMERMNSLGLTDCLRHFNRETVPTFQHSSKRVDHQLDYCYVNAPMLERLTTARVPSNEEVFGPDPRLSDHLPIVCEFY